MTTTRGGDGVSEPRFNHADLALVRRFLEDRAFAMSELLLVQDRDRKGHLVPLVLKPAQAKLNKLVDRIRSFNIAKQLLDPKHQKTMGSHMPMDTDPDQVGFRKLVGQIETFGPQALIHHLRASGYIGEIKDGPVRIVVGKCRRGGISAYVEALGLLEANFVAGFRGLVMAHKGDNTNLIFSYIRNYHGKWAREHRRFRTKTIAQNRGYYEWAGADGQSQGSTFRVQSAGGKSSGRSDQADFYHFSECAFYDDYQEVADTLAAAPDHAWVFEESTANGPQGGYYQRWDEALDIEDVIDAYDQKDPDAISSDKWNGFARYFFSWLEEPAYRSPVYEWEREHLINSLDEHERHLMEELGAEIDQIKWRRQKIKTMTVDAAELDPEAFFAQEYPATPEEMFQSSGSKVFNQKKLIQMQNRHRHAVPVATLRLTPNELPEVVRHFLANLTIWEPPQEGRVYCLGGDVSKGLAHGDYSTAVILDRGDGTMAREVASFRGKPEPEAFGDIVTVLALLYNWAFVCVEVNDTGYVTNSRIVKNRYPFIYHRRAIDRVKESGADTNSFQWGFHSNAASKNTYVGELQAGISGGLVEFRSKQLLHELLIFENVDGKKNAPPGEHDDLVTAAGLAYAAHTTFAPRVNLRWGRKFVPKRETQDADIWREVQASILSEQKRLRKKGRLPQDFEPREWDL